MVVLLMTLVVGCGGRDGETTTTAAAATAAPTTAQATTAAPVAPSTTAVPASTTSAAPTTTVSPLAGLIAGFVGEWSGEWVNTTFASRGPMTVILEAVDDGTLSVSADLDGFVFGQSDPDPEQWIVSLDDLTAPVTVQSATFGEVTLILSVDGARITAADVPAAGIQSFQLDAGFEMGPRIVGTYLVGFDDGSVAEGTTELQRVDP